MTVARWLTMVWLVVTLVGLGWPGSELPNAPSHVDKVVHLFIFATGTVLALTGWPERRGVVVASLLLFAPLAEVWQYVLPTDRSAEVLDAIANALGVGLGATWVTVRDRARRKSRQRRM